jgi:hypothetical protein
VCPEGDDGKYKCPQCRIPYCSLACFKKHKADREEDGSKCAVVRKEVESNNDKTDYGTYRLDEEGNKLERAKAAHADERKRAEEDGGGSSSKPKLGEENLRAIDASEYLRNELKDGGLREMILTIDQSPDPIQALKQATEGYKYGEKLKTFVDKMLVEAKLAIERKGEAGDKKLLVEYVGPTKQGGAADATAENTSAGNK